MQATLCEMFTLRDKTLVKWTSQKSDAWFIACISEVFTSKTNRTSSRLHQFQIIEITPLFWMLKCFNWSNNFWCFNSTHLGSPCEKRQKSTMLTSCFLCRFSDGDNTNTNVLYLSIRSSHLFFPLKKGARFWSLPLSQALNWLNLNFYPLLTLTHRRCCDS